MEIQSIDYRKLVFDPANPRLPENLHGADAAELAKYYYDHGVVSDLVDSMAENGFFPHEPMIVMPQAGDIYKVVEGNRRLTALCIIHQREEALDLPKAEREFAPAMLERLRRVPCLVSEDLEAIHRYIGFRHISGPLTWEPEAKARFLVQEVETAIGKRVTNPFAHVARAVGSRAASVREAYAAIFLLRLIRDEQGFDVAQVQSSRFGVWLRVLSSPEVRKYIGIEWATDFAELKANLAKANLAALSEVLSDLKAGKGEIAVLNDSRDATNYGRVLMNAAARQVLRSTGDLGAAMTITDRESLPERLHAESRRIDALATEVKNATYSAELEEAAKRLAVAAATLFKLSKRDELDELTLG